MTSFVDKSGKKHIIELTVGSARRIQAETGINLLEPLDAVDGKTAFESLAGDVSLIVDTVFAMSRETDAMAFAECFDGETVDRAVKALMEEVINFSRPPMQTLLRKVWAAIQETRDEATATAERVPAEEIKRAVLNCATESRA